MYFELFLLKLKRKNLSGTAIQGYHDPLVMSLSVLFHNLIILEILSIHLNFLPVETRTCGAVLVDTSGIVTYNNRDGFGAYMIDCEWNIVPSEERPIELKFLKFNIRKNLTMQCSFSRGWFDNLITKTRLFKYIENFTTKTWKLFRWKFLIFFTFLLKTQIMGTR